MRAASSPPSSSAPRASRSGPRSWPARSRASPLHRDAILGGGAGATALTRGLTGRLARGVKNRLLDAVNAAGVEVLPYPLQHYLVKNVSGLAEKAGRPELMTMWAGQVRTSPATSATELLDALVSEVSAILGRTFSERTS